MTIQLTHKKVNYGGFYLHHVFYKNLNISALSVLCDQVSELIYNEQISLISHTIYANLKLTKNYSKAEKLTFGDVNWPELWLQNQNNEENISGYYTGISGSTVKTLAGDNFITKIVESNEARYCFAGEIRALKTKDNFEKQSKEVFQTILKVLLISGIAVKHIRQAWYFINNLKDTNKELTKLQEDFFSANDPGNKQIPMTSILGTANQYKNAIQNAFIAIKPNNKNIEVEYCTFSDKDPAKTVVKIKSDKYKGLFFGTNCSSEIIQNVLNEVSSDQITYVLNAYESLLQSEGFEWKNMVRAIAYFKSTKDIKLFKQICKERKIPVSPVLVTESEILTNSSSFNFEADFVKEI